jgi:GTPase
MFIDNAKIFIKGGDGGSGCVAFRREKFVPKGGPSGGDGGRGGDIIIVADKYIHTLLDYKYQKHYAADRGKHGQGANKTGRGGKDTTIRLPVGTVVKDKETDEILIDLLNEGQQKVVALGGKGGRGNARFSTSTNRAPRTWETGGEGQEFTLLLELKLLADVGLVGLPNAGKSTLLSRISAAQPKIADYPFTTLQPNLGIVKVKSGDSFVAADIPGLIEGAHHGKGLGIQFLKHIERTKVLAILIDSTSETMDNDYTVLLNELETYSPELRKKPKILVYSKCDVQQNSCEISDKTAKDLPSINISSVRGDNLDQFKEMVWKQINSFNQ